MKTTRNSILSTVLALVVGTFPAISADLDLEALKKKLPEKITPISPEHLATKVPLSYYFEYVGYPQPGKRLWQRINADTWHEVYPDGFVSEFKVLGHTKVADTQGTIVVKVFGAFDQTDTTNDGGLQAFIPDKGSQLMHHWYRNTSRGDTKWNDLAEMKDVK